MQTTAKQKHMGMSILYVIKNMYRQGTTERFEYANIHTIKYANIYTISIDYNGGAAEGHPPFILH